MTEKVKTVIACWFLWPDFFYLADTLGPGPDYEASEWPTIFPKGSIEIDDSCDENGCNGDFCTATAEGEDEGQEIPCNCNKPEEFIKNMLNKGMFFYIKISWMKFLNEIRKKNIS